MSILHSEMKANIHTDKYTVTIILSHHKPDGMRDVLIRTSDRERAEYDYTSILKS